VVNLVDHRPLPAQFLASRGLWSAFGIRKIASGAWRGPADQ